MGLRAMDNLLGELGNLSTPQELFNTMQYFHKPTFWSLVAILGGFYCTLEHHIMEKKQGIKLLPNLQTLGIECRIFGRIG